MHISISDAQGQLLDLIRKAESGEEVLLTHEGETVGKISATEPSSTRWSQMTPEQRRKTMDEVLAKIRPLKDGGPDAAHSQDFLYDENGLPA